MYCDSFTHGDVCYLYEESGKRYIIPRNIFPGDPDTVALPLKITAVVSGAAIKSVK